MKYDEKSGSPSSRRNVDQMEGILSMLCGAVQDRNVQGEPLVVWLPPYVVVFVVAEPIHVAVSRRGRFHQ